MSTVSELAEDIKRFRLSDLRKESGVPNATLIDIRDGRTKQPRIGTVEAIQQACKKLDRSATKKKSSKKTEETKTKSRKSGHSVAKAGA